MNKSILLVGESHQIWHFAASLLEDRGHNVRLCQSGIEALTSLTDAAADVVVVGEQLADCDGIGCIGRIRADFPLTKIVYLSNSWRDAELYKQLRAELGVQLILHRPIKPALFGIQIESLFSAEGLSTLQQSSEHNENAAFTRMKSRYVRVLDYRLNALVKAVELARKHSSNAFLLQEATRIAHNLKGSVSLCGFMQIARCLGEIELALNFLDPQTALDQCCLDKWDEIEHLLQTVLADADVVQSKYVHELEDDEDLEQVEESARVRLLLIADSGVSEELMRGVNDPLLEVVEAHNAEEALEKADSIPLDAALIDVVPNLAKLSFYLARMLRALPQCEDLPLGFILSDELETDRIEFTHAGGSLFLQRPVDSGALTKAANYLISIRQGGRPRILILDDDSDFTRFISAALGSEGMIVRSISEPSRVLATLQEFLPDLLLLDVLMPGVSGFDVCRMIRSHSRWQDLPIIFLTAHSGMDARISSFESGGDDYLPKPVAAAELLARVKVRLERARLLKERGDRDVLTGLLLRRAFTEQMSALISRSKRHDHIFTLCMLDVDYFKHVNDTYGHQAGDNVLAHLGQLLKQRFRVEDIRGRWGGEEFVLAFPYALSDTMCGAVTRVLEEFRSFTFEGDYGETFNTTFSGGLSSYPADGQNLQALLQAADRRLYMAKECGRNRILAQDAVADLIGAEEFLDVPAVVPDVVPAD